MSSLATLPDISKWNVSKVKEMKNLFKNCSSLVTLPDISKWRLSSISNFNNINNIFENCSSLITLPDISVWKMYGFFVISNCFSLVYIPFEKNCDVENCINLF